ncbi:cupin domain-containing protein [Roseovarius albus]|nr:cupin domain-containing protein [Roseovarius albus]
MTCFGLVAGFALAQVDPPTEHKSLSLEKLGVIEEDMLQRQIGLGGYFMQLRAITIMPGGQIAKHSHETRPGIVKVISGEWVEGRPEGEATYSAEGIDGILEDGDTVHWFYNRGDVPASAIVCDLTPSG